MPFLEKMKLEVRRKAHHQCCMCKALGIEIHHIIPQEENGPDTEDNAAPLCPSCHETYGSNPQKRKLIRETRDLWYEICQDRFGPTAKQLAQLRSAVEGTITRAEFNDSMSKVLSMISTITPRTRGSQRGAAPLTLQQYMSRVLAQNFRATNDCYSVLFFDGFWKDADYSALRESFLRRFGEVFAKQLCRQAQDTVGVNLSDPFTKKQLLSVVSVLYVGVTLNEMVGTGSIAASVSRKGEILYSSLAKVSAGKHANK